MATQQPLQASDVQTLKDNVQGDVLGDGFLKQVELFHFFQIQQAGDFRKKLAAVIPLIASVAAQQNERARVASEVAKIKSAAVDGTSVDAKDKLVSSKQANVAFTSAGLQKLKNAGGNFDTNLSPGLSPDQDFFRRGMEADAVTALHDPPSSPQGNTPKWNAAFVGRKIDGVFLIAANSIDQAEQLRQQILTALGSTVKEVINVPGSARQGQLRRHEHFGYLDGVSEPGIRGFDKLNKDLNNDNREDDNDKELIEPGIVLCKRDQDPGEQGATRPSWTQDGTFLVFRWLEQKVPEFNRDLGEKFASKFGLKNTPEIRDAIGARIIGRWKSGALVTLNPDADPLPLSKQVNMTRQDIDKALNVNLKINFGGFQSTSLCPLGSHIRKMNPRDLGFDTFRIVRRGIQFGPEVSASETANKATDPNNKRGLLFACYQSSIERGFAFIQQSWANSQNFPGAGAGIDPMVGQANLDGEYQMLGMNKANPSAPLTIPFVNPYVVPLGGEYFFVPSIPALRTVLADSSAQGPPAPPINNHPPTPSGPPIPCFVNNRNSGAQPTANVPIDGQTRKLGDLWDGTITGNWMGVGGSVPNNVVIQVSGNGNTFTLPNNQTPIQISAGGPINVSQFTIVGQKTS